MSLFLLLVPPYGDIANTLNRRDFRALFRLSRKMNTKEIGSSF